MLGPYQMLHHLLRSSDPAERRELLQRRQELWPQLAEAGAKVTHGDPGEITILSLGLGRDSITMLLLLVQGELSVQGKLLGPADVDAVVFSDTGMEWDFTYALIPRVQALCDEHGLRFLILRKPPEHEWRAHWFDPNRKKGDRTTPAWVARLRSAPIQQKADEGGYHQRPPVMQDYLRTERTTAGASAACTLHHKVSPISARLMNDLSIERFGISTRSGAWGKLVEEGKRQRHRVLIGIAADEKARLAKGAEAIQLKHTAYKMNFFPLMESKIRKGDEQAILDRAGWGDVLKSGCVACHWQPASHFWALKQTDPKRYAAVVAYEATQNRRRKEEGKPPMYLIFRLPKGEKVYRSVPDAVARWRQAHPNVTVRQALDKEYR